jgi:hypothetical protein
LVRAQEGEQKSSRNVGLFCFYQLFGSFSFDCLHIVCTTKAIIQLNYGKS